MPLELYKRGKIWHYRGTVAGRRLRKSTKTASKETAQRIAADIEQRAWSGHLDPKSTLTFAQAAILYRQAEKSDRFLRKIEDYWRDTPVKDITAGAIRSASITLYPNAGPSTRNRQVIVPTQAVINHAATHGLCQYIRVQRFDSPRKAKEPATWEWVRAFMAAAVKPNLAALACFMYLTGARISQATAVRWSDVNFKTRKVLIKATKKGDDDRLAHMPDVLVAALAKIPGDRVGLVFGFKSRGNCKTQWSKTIKRAGIAKLSYHSCRHGFATGLLDKGISPITVAKRGGWKNPRHVFETYGHDIASDDVTDILIDTPQTQSDKKLSNIK
ncbi:tyrosine-type recombinase/integrase [Pseudolabrys sp.]|uniref:tyrosine-type recombinase/integrase n=1 Tax=Pseudolabrys sp. TaxID=1960880 RepID=UPI003D0980F2